MSNWVSLFLPNYTLPQLSGKETNKLHVGVVVDFPSSYPCHLTRQSGTLESQTSHSATFPYLPVGGTLFQAIFWIWPNKEVGTKGWGPKKPDSLVWWYLWRPWWAGRFGVAAESMFSIWQQLRKTCGLELSTTRIFPGLSSFVVCHSVPTLR